MTALSRLDLEHRGPAIRPSPFPFRSGRPMRPGKPITPFPVLAALFLSPATGRCSMWNRWTRLRPSASSPATTTLFSRWSTT